MNESLRSTFLPLIPKSTIQGVQSKIRNPKSKIECVYSAHIIPLTLCIASSDKLLQDPLPIVTQPQAIDFKGQLFYTAIAAGIPV